MTVMMELNHYFVLKLAVQRQLGNHRILFMQLEKICMTRTVLRGRHKMSGLVMRPVPPFPSAVPMTTFGKDLDGDDALGVGVNEEVASTLQEPFLGIRFNTIAGARAHYNAYAPKMGFSMKSNMSKRTAYTNELEKQQFLCNKCRTPKSEEEVQKERMNVVEQLHAIPVCNYVAQKKVHRTSSTAKKNKMQANVN